MKRLSAVFIFLIPGILFAQTNAEKLEGAVKMYNSTRDFEDDLKPGDVTMDDIYKMKADRAAADALLDDVKTNGSAEEVKVARYFAANYQYEIGFVYGMMGKNREASTRTSSAKPPERIIATPASPGLTPATPVPTSFTTPAIS